ncbi:hypothetical protein E4U19_007420 [Claviceps sp. Clav32 group G5]|nr:hypothetical protein E4U19_007420 [Claviceps sp. Clav32 group G5]
MSPPQDLKTEAVKLLSAQSRPLVGASADLQIPREGVGRDQLVSLPTETYDKPLHSPASAATDPSLAGSTGPFSKLCAGSEIPSASPSTLLANCIRCVFGEDACWRLKVAGDMSVASDSMKLGSPSRAVSSLPTAENSTIARPDPVRRISSNLMGLMSPSDIVGPSPVTSNGTETTEIEDDASDEIEQGHHGDLIRSSELLMLTTNLPDTVRQSNAEEAVSVIHAPKSFDNWTTTTHAAQKCVSGARTCAEGSEEASEDSLVHPPRPPISTDVKPARYSLESATPQAQDCRDMFGDDSRLRSSSTSSLGRIDEHIAAVSAVDNRHDGDDDDSDHDYTGALSLQPAGDENEIEALRTALQECWTLCNTLASLSATHRARNSRNSGTPDSHAKAWKVCWKLCQRLYENQDEDPASHSVRLNLEDLCRDFCQALFDIRQKKDETADSVLRVSFELNNHLYSAQDSRKLPEPFRERTLDFFITLCHRLMKQRTEMDEETDHLLSACWSLAEVLFSLRQNKRDGKPLDEELLGSAVQACWDLGDIFKDGCTQIRPDRSTPRPNHRNFFPHPSHPHHAVNQSGRDSQQSSCSSLPSRHESAKSNQHDERSRHQHHHSSHLIPETPVTEFEDTTISLESRSPPQMPNIMVLGPSSDNGRGGRYSSNASNLSNYSRASHRTSSTAKTTTTTAEDVHIARSQVLVVRAAIIVGFTRDSTTNPKTESASLQNFVRALPSGRFGHLVGDAQLLHRYKDAVLAYPLLLQTPVLPARGSRVTAQDVAESVVAMSSMSPRYTFLRDLFRFVFQFTVDEAQRRNVSIVV